MIDAGARKAVKGHVLSCKPTLSVARNAEPTHNKMSDLELEVAQLRAELALYQEWVQHTIQVASEAAQGNLEARLLHCDNAGELRSLAYSLNHLLDMTDAFLREAGASLEYASNGKFFRRVLLRGMLGTFRHKSQIINTATEKLAANAASLREVEHKVCESSEIASAAEKEATEATKMMKDLERASEKIGGVVKSISEIAWQTKLLSFNATIEAVRAGEAGAGFQVVAQEVKVLAQQTATATEVIEKEIGTVRREVARTAAAFQTITSTIAQMKEISSAIQRAVIEQNSRKE